MRIISGTYKGRRIQAAGEKTTRPTTDRVREAWASTLGSLVVPQGSFEGLKILDAFAGSGALGIELLSRGAEYCLFLEKDKRTFNVIRENLEMLGISSESAQVNLLDTLSPLLPELLWGQEPFDIVILDPPYSLLLERVEKLLNHLAKGVLLKESSLISYEHAALVEDDLDGKIIGNPVNTLKLMLVKRKKYGTITIDYYLCCLALKEET